MALVDGVWEYEESDTASPTFSDLLNLLGDSVRERLLALESTATEWEVVEPMSVGPGWSVSALHVRRLGHLAYVYARGTATTAHTITAATGAITNGTLLTLPAEWWPTRNVGHALGGGNSRVAAACALNSGQLVITAVAGSGDVTVGTAVTVAGTYVID